MVTNAQNYGSSSRGALGRNGVVDWIIQRKTAIFMGVYLIYLVYFFSSHSPLVYQDWLSLFQPIILKIMHGVLLLSLLAHAWVGMWIIATDYLSSFRVNYLFLLICKLALLSYLVWGIYILYMV